jgi:hypothetical protein
MPSPVTSITFTDSIGAATLTNGKNFPGNRFSNWNPMTKVYGDTKHRQSDMVPTHFNLGTMYGASFELRMIPERTTSAVRLVTIADRLIVHLMKGGSCVVNTGDSDTSSYSTCYLFPDTEPSLVLADPNMLEHTLSLAVFNTSTRMVCNYDG